jgi:mannosyltransferase
LTAIRKNWPLLLLIALNLGVKGIFIGSNSLGGDEPFSVYHAQCSIPAIIRFLAATNNPPLYELFLHYWISWFGISEITVRIPSLIFNTITLAYLYLIGKKFFSNTAGITAGFLFIFSNYQILFAHEARVYALFGMLTVISMFYFMKMMIIGRSRRLIILIIITNALLLYAHYFGFFVPLIQSLVIITSAEYRKKFLKTMIISGLILLLLYVPNLMVMITRFRASSGGTWVAPPSGLTSLYNMLWRFSNAPVVTVMAILILALALFRKIIIDRKSGIPEGVRIILIWFLFPYLFMFLISYLLPVFLDRYLVFVSAAYYLTVAVAAEYIIRRKIYSSVLPFALCLLFVITSRPAISNKRNVRETVQHIREIRSDSSIVIVCPHYFAYNFAYYYDPKTFSDTSNLDDYLKIDRGLGNENVYCIDHIDAVDLKDYSHIIFLDAGADFCSPGNNILPTLVDHYQLKDQKDLYEIFRVYDFRK